MSEKKFKFQSGDIYLVRFHPGVGSELQRFRPAVVMSSQVHRIDQRFTLIAPLTTNLKQLSPEFEMQIEHDCLEKASLLLCWYLRTVDVTRMEKKLGRLDEKKIREIQSVLQVLVK